MKLIIDINLDNDAFQDGNCINEIERIFNQIINKLNTGREEGLCIDVNDNVVGDFDIIKEEPC